MIPGWQKRYLQILKEFNYTEKKDKESAILLDSILRNSDTEKKIEKMISKKTVFVIGSGPSLSIAISKLKNFKETIKIVADSAVKPLVDNEIVPDIIITDLDGDEPTLKKLGKTKSIIVVHAHGDNIKKLEFASQFKNSIGTTQTKPFGKLHNFGGFTDGDRGVFLANQFGAKKIILFGMDLGNRIGKFSNTKKAERKTKIMKLQTAESLLEWLANNTESELLTTSRPIKGFKKIPYSKLADIIIT